MNNNPTGSFGKSSFEAELHPAESAPTCSVSPLNQQYLYKGTNALTSEATSMMASGPLSNLPLYQQSKVVSRQYELPSRDLHYESRPLTFMHQRGLNS